LAASVTEAARKIKEGAVEINGERIGELLFANLPGLLVIRVGKKWKRVKAG
jgi:tyrosyl-tRNA synthetase